MPTISFQPNPGNSRLSLDLTEPNKTEELWEITVTAIVSDDGKPAPGIQVQLYHNGRAIDSPYLTDGEGRTEPRTFSDLEKGTHTFEAIIVSTSIKARRTVKLKDERPKKPAKLIVDREYAGGSNDKVIVFCTVLTDDNVPVKGIDIRILGLTNPTLATTDKSGVATMKIKLEKNHRVVVFIVKGSPIQKRIHLFRKTGKTS
ncbi:MAG: hypothetical protein WCX12_03345 [Candidatus Paceibacterota bacterium]|jgi:hypothetical protein